MGRRAFLYFAKVFVKSYQVGRVGAGELIEQINEKDQLQQRINQSGERSIISKMNN